ncbi:centrin-1 [Thecamonas trahens ATCC 50062]|uniref:Centrin-1 n=1 Tax=Thecamonas trahens ATCC 50062 TaxID=461836 RepID=A0A0L0DRV7_THETB|nr:centrin-1 [Thecamonas trahens ATCC 50062]KNC54977.1 centrin-1 [Thecamonas trahens ATCC 50062]|eukprot:XP_013753423.1 centrin-1 [Thecamonas trahens ATCC 50062]
MSANPPGAQAIQRMAAEVSATHASVTSSPMPSSLSAGSLAPTGRARERGAAAGTAGGASGSPGGAASVAGPSIGGNATGVSGSLGRRKKKRLPEFDDDTRADLAKAFAFLDHDGSGRIGPAELKIAFEALGKRPSQEELKKIVAHYGKREASLDFDQFVTIMREKMWEEDTDEDISRAYVLFNAPEPFLDTSVLFPPPPDQVRANSSTLDKLVESADGISFDDLARIAELVGEELTHEDLQEMMEEAFLAGGSSAQRRYVPLDDAGYPDLRITREMFEKVMREGARSFTGS